MLRRRLYYTLKPYLPWRLRIAVRRLAAARKLKSAQGTWPINPATAAVPPGWPGWPDGKKFAFVLTHDVEGLDGVAKSQHLAEIEMAHGFRSSFNFIPEGDYSVSPELRVWLSGQGFEVGLHDLRHDGELYLSRSIFRENAKLINEYAKAWGATGFRSGFMLHELEWIHDLNVAYDASTFDTDPFEPQPDAAGTIFPFWIPPPADRPDRPGYVELPYSLPQDSTLFLILRETSPEIWIRKLDWVAEHGGMALINVHPDYLRFDGESTNPRTFPVTYYRQLLEHVRQRYAGAYWQPLPRELAAWYQGTLRAAGSAPAPAIPGATVPAAPTATPDPALRGKRVAVILYSYFPADPRPYRAATAMAAAGMEVDVLCLTNTPGEPANEVVEGIRVHRVPIKHTRGSKFAYVWNYGLFFATAFWFLVRRGLRRPYHIVHVHNMPDFLVFAAAIPKLRGAKIILDLHDPMPELMMTIYELQADDWHVRLMRALERGSIRFSQLVLTPNIAFKNLFASRGCPPAKIQVVMNSPEEQVFDPSRFGPDPDAGQNPAEFRIMHHGSIVHRHGVDLLVEAVAQVRPRIPGLRLDIYGPPTPFLDVVLATAQRLGIADIVHFHGEKTQLEIADAIRECHLGVVPNRRSVFTEINFPTRLFEYMAMHRPVVAPSTEGIRDYFTPEQLLMFVPNDVSDMAAKILWARENPEGVRHIVAHGNQAYRDHLWREEKAGFLAQVAATLRSR
jgi:glycosyltransferase involved in cell wall biosynthesis